MGTLQPHAFIEKWSHSTLKERASYQQHFLDICHLVNHPEPADLDRNGTFFTFEAGAKKTVSDTDGFADVWFREHFAWEYKGKHGDLRKAYAQLLQYREALENPPLLIVSDIDSIVIHTNFTNTVKRTFTLSLEDVATSKGVEVLRNVFFNPEAFISTVTKEGVTEQAATKFAELAEVLRNAGYGSQASARFLIQMLFCLFAEDTGLLPDRLFTRLANNFRNDSVKFTHQLSILFDQMSSGGAFGIEPILHFDGHLFENSYTLDIGEAGLEIINEVSRLDWASIEPSIFGTLFERSLEPSKRSQLGAHYTSKDDILLIIEPVLMAPLKRNWVDIQQQARELAKKQSDAKGYKRTSLQTDLKNLLTRFADEIAAVQVLDAACGSGNFLYLALRELLNLQKAVITLAGELGVGTFFPSVTPKQLHGIEINETAHQLAQAAIQIGYIQWLRENGYGIPSEPILNPLDNIIHGDAILGYDSNGKAIEPEWPVADVLIGNPPFLGDKKMRAELGDAYVVALRELYKGRVSGGADLVIFWFERARAQIDAGKLKRSGLLSTNSIRTGSNRLILDRIKTTGDIFMAWEDRPWILDGAAVRVSMVGFDDGKEIERFLNGQPVKKINADLTARVDVTQAKPLAENDGLCFLGMMKAGPFDIDDTIAQYMLSAPRNPNGRLNSDVIKHRLGGQDVTGRDRGGWIIDFGVDLPCEMAALYEMPFEYVLKNVKPVRDNNRRERTKQRWWIFGEARPGLRRAIANKQRCIVTPEVAKHRIFVWMDSSVIPDHKLHVIARDDDYFFGVLQSRSHEIWSLAQCSWMGVGNDPSYSSTRTFETFPFPWAPGKEPIDDPRVQTIAEAACTLVELRERWLNPPEITLEECKKRTMTNLYNQRPTWLENAQRDLDQAVFAAYGWPSNLSDEAILEKLLYLNLERSSR